jgi:hypothetical protein
MKRLISGCQPSPPPRPHGADLVLAVRPRCEITRARGLLNFLRIIRNLGRVRGVTKVARLRTCARVRPSLPPRALGAHAQAVVGVPVFECRSDAMETART